MGGFAGVSSHPSAAVQLLEFGDETDAQSWEIGVAEHELGMTCAPASSKLQWLDARQFAAVGFGINAHVVLMGRQSRGLAQMGGETRRHTPCTSTKEQLEQPAATAKSVQPLQSVSPGALLHECELHRFLVDMTELERGIYSSPSFLA